MYRIIRKKVLNPAVVQMEIEAPLVAAKAKPGQFIILRVDAEGERIPLTVAGCDKKEGSVKIIFEILGATTEKLAHKEEGEFIEDFAGPLGKPTEIEGLKKVCVIGGGVGCAIAMPIAKALKDLGAQVVGIIGFRRRDLVILEDEFEDGTDRLFVTTDDGSYKIAGRVTDKLSELLEDGEKFDMIFAIGPLMMMKYVTLTAKPYHVPVTVSMNPIMIDGTGMCGCCRLTLTRADGDGEEKIVKFACVDGPDFNGYEVDFDEAEQRSHMYADFERRAREATCNLFKKEAEE